MNIKGTSFFKNPEEGKAFLEKWSLRIQQKNGATYSVQKVDTSLGETVVWTYNEEKKELPSILFFPGARTCGMFWDMDNALQSLRTSFRIFIAEVNGQASLSEGKNPSIKGNDYGIWAGEVIDKLGLQKTNIAGASLGGLICMKLALVHPEKTENAFLFNPAGLQMFSMSLKNLYYTVGPVISKSRKSILKFLDNAIFHSPEHILPEFYYEAIVEYQEYVIRNHKFKGDYPNKIANEELKKIESKMHVFLGTKDLLFPTEKSRSIAQTCFKHLGSLTVFEGVAHGIETYKPAHEKMKSILTAGNH